METRSTRRMSWDWIYGRNAIREALTSGARVTRILVARSAHGLPIDQIGYILSMSENNAWVSLHRARERFRKVYARRFGREQEL